MGFCFIQIDGYWERFERKEKRKGIKEVTYF
jgi:hypothetical protein